MEHIKVRVISDYFEVNEVMDVSCTVIEHGIALAKRQAVMNQIDDILRNDNKSLFHLSIRDVENKFTAQLND